MACPNHDADQLCPDCTYRPTASRSSITFEVQNAGRTLRVDLTAAQHSIDGMAEALAKTEHKVIRGKTNIYVPCALCNDATDFQCNWTHRGYDASEQAKSHTLATGHPTSVETLTRTEYTR